MDNFFAVTPINNDPFMITWDLGRRCNYDCSYCPPHRHDNFSSHASLKELKSTLDFLFEYITLISTYRSSKEFSISFTGGEPTVNPNFMEFSLYLVEKYKTEYKNKFNLFLDLTTNGAMGKKMVNFIIENLDHVTISYHPEASNILKKQVLDNIKFFNSSNIKLKVNVMFHVDYFNECVDFCQLLSNDKIKYIPRIIGETSNSKFSHIDQYTESQKKWFEEYWGLKLNQSVRPCCGNRTMGLCGSNGITESKVVNFREFKDWYCSVNWYFLHIDQQLDAIYTHQTCQATFDNTKGPIGKISEWKKIIDDLKSKFETKTMSVIICPNKICGCGLCTPKSKHIEILKESMEKILTDTTIINYLVEPK
jgi:MoaA/NifB/PqqE/SkfB family radical SAM enzyme